MAKLKKFVSFKGNLNFEDGVPIITEIGKEETKYYNIINALMEFDGIDGVGITISADEELPSEED